MTILSWSLSLCKFASLQFYFSCQAQLSLTELLFTTTLMTGVYLFYFSYEEAFQINFFLGFFFHPVLSVCFLSYSSLKHFLSFFLKTTTSSEGFFFLLEFIFMLVTFYSRTHHKRAPNPAYCQSLWNSLDLTVHYICL